MLNKILYYFLLKPISILPFGVLYLISNCLKFFLYHLIKYRRSVVRNNLLRSFPEKKLTEIKKIEAEFYTHLCDLVVESIKSFSISLPMAKRRMVDKNIGVLNAYADGKRPIVLVGGHYGNWELFAMTIADSCKTPVMAIYTPIKNTFINEKVTESRSKYGLKMLSIKEIRSMVSEIGKKNSTVIFGSDQSPRKHQKAYWMNFLNQNTAVQFGAEKFAKDFDAIVVFAHIQKVKRGYYEIEYKLISDQVEELPHGYITQKHTKLLEEVIQKKPPYWLWSHKRWKLQLKETDQLNEAINFESYA